jgi:hypothetical protein
MKAVNLQAGKYYDPYLFFLLIQIRVCVGQLSMDLEKFK